LLDMAGVANSADARSELVLALQFARLRHGSAFKSHQRAPPELFEQLETSVRKTLGLLRRIKKYPGSCGMSFVLCPVERGDVVDVATTQDMLRGRRLQLPQHPSISDKDLRWLSPALDGMIAGINVELVLRKMMLHQPGRRVRGGPKKVGKHAIVHYAAGFFRLHSSEKPTTNINNSFRRFAEQFYRTVTGQDVDPGGLEWQIRSVLKDKSTGE
jgi:hypothetical protein